MTKTNVHTEHCCKRHGCKYMDEDCPVYINQMKQSFPCEDCEHEYELIIELLKPSVIQHYYDLGFQDLKVNINKPD